MNKLCLNEKLLNYYLFCTNSTFSFHVVAAGNNQGLILKKHNRTSACLTDYTVNQT